MATHFSVFFFFLIHLFILFFIILYLFFIDTYVIFFFFSVFFLTLQYCIGFAIYQHESATGIHVVFAIH